jgi:hypothetical protein
MTDENFCTKKEDPAFNHKNYANCTARSVRNRISYFIVISLHISLVVTSDTCLITAHVSTLSYLISFLHFHINPFVSAAAEFVFFHVGHRQRCAFARSNTARLTSALSGAFTRSQFTARDILHNFIVEFQALGYFLAIGAHPDGAG